MLDEFKRELDLNGGTAKDVVEVACALLGVNADGKTVGQQAAACWELLHLPCTITAPASDDVPVGLPVDDVAAPPPPPPVGRGISFGSSAAEQRQCSECPVCFDDLCSDASAYFVSAGGKRVCSHHTCHRCALSLPAHTCPICRAGFAEVRKLPSLDDDPAGFFDACDVIGDGALSREHAMRALLAQFPLDVAKFEHGFNELWPTLAHDARGRMRRTDFFDDNTGLLAFARRSLPNMTRPQYGDVRAGGGREGAAVGAGGAEQRAAGPPPPDIRIDRDAWFTYFDGDCTGVLTAEEVVRGLIKTFGLASDLAQVQAMRTMVTGMWPVFAPDGGGVSRDAFNYPLDGLADAIIANLEPDAVPQHLERDRQLAMQLRARDQAGAGAAARHAPPPPSSHAPPPPPPPLELPPNIKACPACGMLIEKIDGDDQVMCGCEARPAGGTYEKALAGGGCGHEWNWASFAPLGCGRPGAPANERQVRFLRSEI